MSSDSMTTNSILKFIYYERLYTRLTTKLKLLNNLTVYYHFYIAHMQGTDIRDSHAGGPDPLWGPLIALRVTYG